MQVPLKTNTFDSKYCGFFVIFFGRHMVLQAFEQQIDFDAVYKAGNFSWLTVNEAITWEIKNQLSGFWSYLWNCYT